MAHFEGPHIVDRRALAEQATQFYRYSAVPYPAAVHAAEIANHLGEYGFQVSASPHGVAPGIAGVEIIDPADEAGLRYRLKEIHYPTQYLGQEHFQQLIDVTETPFSDTQALDRLFGSLVGRPLRGSEPTPRPPLLTSKRAIVSRAEAGFPRPPKGWFDAAIKVRPLMTFASWVERKKPHILGFGEGQAMALGMLAAYLADGYEG
jgi:hypothetical protein